MTLAPGALLALVMFCGVMRMYWIALASEASFIIMLMAILRLTASMKTSNSSRQRIGQPTDSHNAKSRQMVEKDFSPPERARVSLRRLLVKASAV